MYQPLCCYSGGTPFWLVNKESSGTFLYLLGLDLLSIALVVWLQITSHNNPGLETYASVMSVVTCLLFVVTNLSYLLTTGLNPGIRNPASIPAHEYATKGKEKCAYCSRDRLLTMRHCTYCFICVEEKDHHCSVLNRCVAGKQVYPFVVLLISVCATFLLFFVALIGGTIVM